jgi:hypothetical protein
MRCIEGLLRPSPAHPSPQSCTWAQIEPRKGCSGLPDPGAGCQVRRAQPDASSTHTASPSWSQPRPHLQGRVVQEPFVARSSEQLGEEGQVGARVGEVPDRGELLARNTCGTGQRGRPEVTLRGGRAPGGGLRAGRSSRRSPHPPARAARASSSERPEAMVVVWGPPAML